MRKLTYFLTTIAIAGLFCGCASFNSNAGKTVGTIAISVEASRQVYNDLVRENKLTPVQMEKAEVAYANYQLAMRTVHSLWDSYQTFPAQKPMLEQALVALQDAMLAFQVYTIQTNKP